MASEQVDDHGKTVVDLGPKIGEAKSLALETLAEFKNASRDLKHRIIDEKRKNDTPINSSLGNPDVDARNADWRNDLPESDDD